MNWISWRRFFLAGIATPQLLAWVIICKFLDHLPLYRIEQIAARQGVPLARSNLSEWLGKIGLALEPIAQLRRNIYASDDVCMRMKHQCPNWPPKRVKFTAPIYGYIAATTCKMARRLPSSTIEVPYQTSRSGEHARNFLNNWDGYLMVDDFAGYKALFKEKVQELACWVHARRKFFDLHVANGSALAKAFDYTLRRWPALTRYAETGDLPIDNNPPKTPCDQLQLVAKTGAVPNVPATAPPASTAYSPPPNSTALKHMHGW